jgi:hypothetical protein
VIYADGAVLWLIWLETTLDVRQALCKSSPALLQLLPRCFLLIALVCRLY